MRGVISVQVLNEFASVASRRLAMRLPEIREALSAVRAICSVEPLSEQTYDLALDLVERFQLSLYDGVIVAAALLAKCGILYSEDMRMARGSGRDDPKSVRRSVIRTTARPP